MARTKPDITGRPRKQEGQGVVEAMVTLPAFLLLVSLVFQLHLVALAQVHLQYAAFCAARVGVVRNADLKEMQAAVSRVLTPLSGRNALAKKSFRVEVLPAEGTGTGSEHSRTDQNSSLLRVRLHWDYPLNLPLKGLARMVMIPENRSLRGLIRPSRGHTIPLQATWVMAWDRDDPVGPGSEGDSVRQ